MSRLSRRLGFGPSSPLHCSVRIGSCVAAPVLHDSFVLVRRFGLALGILLMSTSAHALVWPDVPEQVEKGLQAQDPATRRIAANQIRSLGPARGAPLAILAMGDPDVEVRLAAAQSATLLHVTSAT